MEIKIVDMDGNEGTITGMCDWDMNKYTEGSLEGMTPEEIFDGIVEQERALSGMNTHRKGRINLEVLAETLGVDIEDWM